MQDSYQKIEPSEGVDVDKYLHEPVNFSHSNGDVIDASQDQESKIFNDDPDHALENGSNIRRNILGRFRARDVVFQRLQNQDDEHTDLISQNDNRTAPQDSRDNNSRCSSPISSPLTAREYENEDVDVTPQAGKNLINGNDDESADDPADSSPVNPFRLSLDDDDDIDNDEDDVRRYSLDFNVGTKSHGKMLNNENDHDYISSSHEFSTPVRSSLEEGTPERFDSDNDDFKRFDDFTTPVRQVCHILQSARIESRRKRMERLLELPDEHSATSRCHYLATRIVICFSSAYCDLIDKGFILVIVAVVIFVVVYQSLDEKEDRTARKLLLGVGVPIIIFRVGWRPLYWFVWGRIVEEVSVPVLHDGLFASIETCSMITIIPNFFF